MAGSNGTGSNGAGSNGAGNGSGPALIGEAYPVVDQVAVLVVLPLLPDIRNASRRNLHVASSSRDPLSAG